MNQLFINRTKDTEIELTHEKQLDVTVSIISYILQGTAYCRMLYEMYGLLPKKIVICSLIRFDPMKYNPMMDEDIYVDWKVFNPLDYIRQLKSICDAYHFKKG